MKILDRYIGKSVFISMVIVMLVLLSFFSFAAFVGELDQVGRGRYTLVDAGLYITLMVPQLLVQLSPMMALIGGLLGLGLLANQSELSVMRAAGVSVGRIFWSVMKVGLAITFLLMIVGEFLAPKAQQLAEELRSKALLEKFASKTSQGFWLRDGAYYINIKDIFLGGRLNKVTIYRINEHGNMDQVIYADSADYVGKKWVLKEVQETQLTFALESSQGSGELLAHTRQYSSTTRQLKEMRWEGVIHSEVLDTYASKPGTLSTFELSNYIDYLKSNGLDAAQYELAYWTNIVSPFTTVVMLMLAVPFVFGSTRSVSTGQRLFGGTLVGIGFFLANRTIGSLGLVYGVTPMLSASSTTLLFFFAALILMRGASK